MSVIAYPRSEVKADCSSACFGLGRGTDTQAARILYLQNNYEPIPLKPKSKDAAVKKWQSKPTITQWKNANPHGNIGLRAGNGKAFIDCDDKNRAGTFETVTRWLAGLGHKEGSYPVIETPNRGAHIYINFASDMLDSKKNLLPSIGAGEFRYGPGAYVCAWPSVIEVGNYKIVSGDIAQLPVLDLADIRQLVNVNEVQAPRIQKKMSRLAAAIANGTKPDKYQSASEGESALVLSLINSQFTYEDIKHVFNTCPCLGHYSQKHAAKGSQEGERWLYMTYHEMSKYSQHESPARRKIAQLMQQVQAEAWSNANRKQVFLSHLQIAHRAGKPAYAAGVRDIAIGAGVHKDTASNQTKRLVNNNLLFVKEPGTTISATVYSLNLENLGHSLRALNVRECPKFSGHDAFRNGGGKHAKNRLGRRAGEIYELIFDNPLTVDEIAKQTGAQVETVIQALEKMHKVHNFRTGEIIEMVSCDGGAWYSNLVDLDVIAAISRTYGATGKQRRDYQDERKAHKRALELGTIKREQMA